MSEPFTIKTDDPGRPEVAALIQQHLRIMAHHSPPESCHAFNVSELSAPDVTFWSVSRGEELAGFGALKQLDPTHGEIKSMRTVETQLRKGVASLLLKHMIAEARSRKYVRLSLETGSADAYGAARNLYSRFGFEACGPFASYALDPHSLFMTRKL